MNHLIEIKNVSKKYLMGVEEVNALRDVSLIIDSGEFIAIMGQSGSGKSTLLNILGFLDVTDKGSYEFLGRDVTRLQEDELSILRNNIAGFVFQQFQLLPRLSATDNVLLPTIYAGKKNVEKQAEEKLKWVGLGHRINHFPNELSGGEQQRVAIARSMANEPVVIFADEPTGNLDTKSEAEIMSILKKLNSEGKTIIMVTHENEIAEHASRIIRMKDGLIISDTKTRKTKKFKLSSVDSARIDRVLKKSTVSFGRAEFFDYFQQAIGSIVSHKMRSLLSMLGILIGVAAVISMLAIGEGAKDSISKKMSSLGTNLLTIRPGMPRHGGVAYAAGTTTRFTMQDAKALLALPEVKRVSPGVNDKVQAVYGNKNCKTDLAGVGKDYETMKSASPIFGRFFTEAEQTSRAKVALVGLTVVKSLFGTDDPIGKIIKINKINFTVIGVLPAKGAAMFRDQDDIIVVPVTTAMYRVLGKKYIDMIETEVVDASTVDLTIPKMKQLIIKRNRSFEKENSFNIMDMSDIRNMMMSTATTMSMLLGAVAAISLVVGGVGIMNIMLVSVRERTREIGLRKALGARRKDILVQFVVEAVIMTFSGGIAGIALGVSVTLLLAFIAGWAVKISVAFAIAAALFSIMIGIGFGIWPAIVASKLNPIEALRYE